MKPQLKLGAALVALAAFGAISACSQKQDATADTAAATPAAPEADTAAAKPVFGDWGIDLAQRDQTVAPGDDFARYVNGAWLDSFVIPADLPGYVSFTMLRLEAEDDIKAIVEELAAKDSAKGSLEQKVGDFYKSWMDVDAVNAAGAAPLKSHLDEIYAIDTPEAMMLELASIHNNGPAGFGVIPDPADTTKNIVYVDQSGLGMPDRDYYLKDDERFVKYRAAYKTFIENMLTYAGIDGAPAKADAIIAFETKIAQLHWTHEDSRDIEKIYNPMGPEQLAELAPEMNWELMLDSIGLNGVKTFLVAQPSAIQSEAKLFAEADPAFLKDWLAFQFINNHAQYLSSDFDTANFEFFSKSLRGVEEQRERWKRGINQIDASLGEAVGQIYVQQHFPPSSKVAMDGLVENLTDALAVRLEQNEWMDDATREQALLKLSTFEPRIGYPSKWTDYSSLEIGDSLFKNALALTEFAWQDQLDQLDRPVDRERWGYPPQTVNASYNPLLNQITFPAGILQAPFFDPNADAAVNYGAIGAVIGHEIGHGFDDQGRQFDEMGRIRDWWTPESAAAFKAKTDELGAQYDSYEPIPGAFISGSLTMGENIGDLGGLQMAYAAYHRYLDETSGGEAPVIDGFSGDQRFFRQAGMARHNIRTAQRGRSIRLSALLPPTGPPESAP
ncbi:MAG: M13 family metallopeptidase [Parvularculaceae bacterium]